MGRLSFASHPKLAMPPRQRNLNEIAPQIVPLLLLGIGLVMTNNSITIIDDEANIIGDAASPAWTILRPVAVEPVKAIFLTPGCSASRAPAVCP